jgi:hypothetical protein
MGDSYISASLADSLNNEFNNLHATFGRPIAIFKTAQEIVVSTSNNHNFLFQGAPNNDTVIDTVQSGVFLARVLYGKKQEKPAFGGFAGQQPSVALEEGEVRLKLDPTGAAYFAGAERATVDGNILRVITSPRPHGLIGNPNFVTLYFKKLD